MRFLEPPGRTFYVCRSILWLASWLSPARERVRWREDQTRHVWHWCRFLADSGQLNRDDKLDLARFCWNAFPSAFWLRFDRDRFFRRQDALLRSPWTCLSAIALVVLVLTLASGILPVAQSFLSSPIPQPNRLCVVSLKGKFRRVHSQTLFNLASAWQSSKLLEAVAPYSWGPGKLTGSRRAVPVLAARVSAAFFQVLGLHAAAGRTLHAGDERDCSTCMVLGYDAWQTQFGADPSVIGRQVKLDGVERTVIGVLPRNFHLLGPEVSVWTLLDSGSSTFTNFVERIGAVARMKPGATEAKVEADLVDLSENAGYVFPASMLMVTPALSAVHHYLNFYLLFALLAVACAAFIVYARSGSGTARAPVMWPDRFRWWSFFTAKSVLLLIATGLFAWATVRGLSLYFIGAVHPLADGAAVWLFLVLAVAPLSWAIYDQQRRCRICLRRLGTPVQIGAPGHVLLNWSGTEMVCPQGHGVLYLSDSQANWLARDRWDNLDDSWADLFHET